MSHLVLELALWIILAFFIGCIIGCLLRRLFGGGREALADGPDDAAADQAIETEPVSTQVESAPAGAEAGTEMTEAAPPLAAALARRPTGIAEARDGKSDDLQRISGVGPKNEKTLHGLGFFHFDQIAAWTGDEIAWVDEHLKFNGRIKREEWTNQARLLAEGKEEEFRRLYGTGGMENKDGETESGSRTRND